MLIPVIMAGGSGSRLWPLSRLHYPKQFINLLGKDTLLQQTLQRLDGMGILPPYFICNEEHRFLVAEQLRSHNRKHSGILLEPVGRNTAPAIALSALSAIKNNQDPILLILAADHSVQDINAFQQTVLSGVSAANKGKLVTFGIVPNEPHTGYGYIKKGMSFDENGFLVDCFVEKPNLETAQGYLQSGQYLWNSGMFMFKASRYLQELEKFAPDILQCCKDSLDNSENDLDFTRIDKEIFASCRDESVDYAVMEHTDDAIVIPMDAGWSDVGAWTSIWDISKKDEDNNLLQGDTITINTTNSLIRGDNKLVATIGVKDLIIVDTKDAVMIADKNSVQDIKDVVNILKKEERSEYKQHREVYRPWGKHDHIADGEHYHVKKVTIKPNEKISLQAHYHRSEHWIVLSGTAVVHKNDKEFILTQNESTYIPAGSWHSIENRGKIPLEIIEVRSGDYLEEDDIVRI